MNGIKSIYQELQAQCNISIPAIIGLVFYKIPWMISLHFVGALGPESLAAAALATTLCNVTGLSFSVGLSSAITTLTGQSRGHLLKKGHEMQKQRKMRYNSSSRRKKNHGGDEESVLLVMPPEYNNTNHGRNRVMEPLVEKKNEISHLIMSSEQRNGCKGNTFPNEEETNEYNDRDDSDSPLLPLVFLYRGIIVQLYIVVPIGLWWIQGIEPLLLTLRQAENLSKMTTIYLRILTPGLWSYSINWTLTAWLQAMEMADVPAYAAFVGCVCHLPFNILFVNILGFGYEGVGMATVAFQVIQPLLMVFYLLTKAGRSRILEQSGAKILGREYLTFWPELYAAVFSLSGIKQYLALGLPGMVSISEWWASEFCIFLGGTLHPNPDYALGAMSIYQSINSFCFMFPMGFSTAGSSRVGFFLGRNQPNQARLASKLSIWSSGLASVVLGSILLFTPHTMIPSLFTSDENVLLQTSYTIPLLAFYVVADGLQIGLQGTIKGVGKQFIVAPIVVFSYWIVGVPLAYYNTFVKNGGIMECGVVSLCGVRGLVFGILTGTYAHMILLFIVVVFSIDWRKEATKAEARMSMKHVDDNLSASL